MEWTYHVQISTEAGSSISEAVEQLSTSQELAKNEFERVNELLSGDKFTQDILDALQDKLSTTEHSDENLEEEKDFTEIPTILQELKSAISLLKDDKKSFIKDILDSIKKDQDDFKSSNIADNLQEMFGDRLNEFSENIKGTFSDLINEFNKQFPFANETEVSKLTEEEDVTSFSEKFSQSSVSSLDDFIEDLRPKVTQSLSKEIKNFLDSFDISGTELFNSILGDEKGLLKELSDELKKISKAKREIESLEQNTELSAEEKEAKLNDLRNQKEAAENYLNDEQKWKDFKNAFAEGLKSKIKESDNELLKNDKIIEMLSPVIEDLLNSTKESVLGKSKTNTNAANFARDFSSVLSEDKQSQIVSSEGLQEFSENERDPSELISLITSLDELMKISQIELIEKNEPSENLRDVLKNKIDEEGFPDLSEFFSDVMMYKLQKDESSTESVEEKDIGEFLKSIEDSIMEINKKMNMNDFNKKEETENDDEEEQDILNLLGHFEAYLEAATDNRNELFMSLAQNIAEGNQILKEDIHKSREHLNSRIGQALNTLSIIASSPSDNISASPTNLKSSIGG